MFRSNDFLAEMASLIVGVLLVVATTTFVTVPYSLDHYPLTVAELGTTAQHYHLS
jgi:hypothetical protein